MNHDEVIARVREDAEAVRKCQHRWEPSTFGQKYWEPHSWQYTCARCGTMKLFVWEPKK